MSTVVMAVCWPIQIPSTPKAVLISLADQANDQGLCWPSIAGIAERTCFGRTAVMAAIKWLAAAELLSIAKTGGRTNHYRLNLERLRRSDLQPVRQTDGCNTPGFRRKTTVCRPDSALPVRQVDGWTPSEPDSTPFTRPPAEPVDPPTAFSPVREPDRFEVLTRPPADPPSPPGEPPPVHLAHQPVRQVDLNRQEPSKQPSKKRLKICEIKPVDLDDLIAEGVSEEAATEFLALRRRKKAPLTPLAWQGIQDEAAKAGWTLTDALAKAVRRNWQGFEAAWVAEESRGTTTRTPTRNPNRQEALEARNQAVADAWLHDSEAGGSAAGGATFGGADASR